jgi:hypothetical protein
MLVTEEYNCDVCRGIDRQIHALQCSWPETDVAPGMTSRRGASSEEEEVVLCQIHQRICPKGAEKTT